MTRLILAEGPETALSIWSAYSGKEEVWSTLGVSNFAGAALQSRADEVIIAADGETRAVLAS